MDQQGTHTYAYDNVYRLTSVTYPGPATTTYAFDAFGNRTSKVDAGGTTSYSYDDNDRITTVTPPSPASAISYTWDNNGDLTGRGGDSFSWDVEDRLTSATVNSVTTTFAYRGDGLRESRTSGGSTTTFTWDLNRGLPVMLDDGNQYVYGGGLEAMRAGSSWYYYLADGLGSTMAVVDASGAVAKSYTYDVYGKPTAAGSLANAYDFAGQATDASGLQYLRARYMDPETGTFLSREPLARVPGWLGNPFNYGAGNPARAVDPTGLQPCDSDGPCGSGGATGGGDPGYQGENGPQPCVLSYDGCWIPEPPIPGPGDAVDLGGAGGVCNQSNLCEFIVYLIGPVGEYYGVKVNRNHVQTMAQQKWDIGDLYDVLQDPEYVYRQTKGNNGLFAHVRRNKDGLYDVLATDRNGIIYGSARGVSRTKLDQLADEFGWVRLP